MCFRWNVALYIAVRSASQQGVQRWTNAPGTLTNNNYTMETIFEISWPSALIGQLKKTEREERKGCIKGHLGNKCQQWGKKRLESWWSIEDAVHSSHHYGLEPFSLEHVKKLLGVLWKIPRPLPRTMKLTHIKDFLSENSLSNIVKSKVWTISHNKTQ